MPYHHTINPISLVLFTLSLILPKLFEGKVFKLLIISLKVFLLHFISRIAASREKF